MRFSNDQITWSDWETYQPDKINWQLNGNSGTNTVYAQLATGPNGSGNVYQSQDDIEFTGTACDPMTFSNEIIEGPITYINCLIHLIQNVTVEGNVNLQADETLIGPNTTIENGDQLTVQNN